ncbi:peptidase domain-containing ABC transporter [Niveibacterium sp. 24ML]|uniref:peptidase domain-containing ABC transporter n=1 Tax=Niveibacterium sp. 24ML TaxID=2985512 RepID=UPI002270D2DA|nr:peptidase domain-containing ABC transporter [Niveibacterium sp. 24ML]MCX9158053.1 peptidase domain-containing ABC transporter [Niveibacterium sp. 24ML]
MPTTPARFLREDFLWALGSLCALHRRPFSAELVEREFPPPLDATSIVQAGRTLNLKVRQVSLKPGKLSAMTFPLLVTLVAEAPDNEFDTGATTLAIVTMATEEQVVFFRAGTNAPTTTTLEAFAKQFSGTAWLTTTESEALSDEDGAAAIGVKRFGFKWFVPELMKHRRVWRDVLLASAALQVVALATPLFTQAIIDKVVVHRTQSTLIAIAIAMAIFTVFSAILTWVRQYLVLHTGNRVDAVLAAAVWDHLLKLPTRYFEHRPTGVVAARLHAVENIREFVSGAAVTLVLDLPFLLICLGVMLWYSVPLTAVSLGGLALIAVVSFLVAPVFQARLNEQFLLGARNQAFLTEHIAGFETVKSLQMEPQLRKRYADYLASYLRSGFQTKQIGNTYNVFATTMDQLMTLGILMFGAWIVMTEPSFTIGMLVAFQMFAGKLSQPILRVVGLWTQFQQASLSVQRLGDVMNVPAEPYGVTPQRPLDGKGRIELVDVAFRYRDDTPLLYQNISLTIEPGRAVAIMGPSGAGKSTLAKLLLGFYQPTSGQLRVDGVDARHMSANELRAYFGVVPQETILFSGTVLANLLAANPNATFEQAVQACRMAGIHDVIDALAKGYQTELGERGVGLSGGQKQRLAIARALLKGPKVLIFDEATSALDGETAESFARTINGLKGKVTMLFITHAMPRSLKIDEVLQLSKDGIQQLKVMPTTGGDLHAQGRVAEVRAPEGGL